MKLTMCLDFFREMRAGSYALMPVESLSHRALAAVQVRCQRWLCGCCVWLLLLSRPVRSCACSWGIRWLSGACPLAPAAPGAAIGEHVYWSAEVLGAQVVVAVLWLWLVPCLAPTAPRSAETRYEL